MLNLLKDVFFILQHHKVRFITLGLLKSHVIVVVHTERAESIRIISARKATRHESELYFKQIAD